MQPPRNELLTVRDHFTEFCDILKDNSGNILYFDNFKDIASQYFIIEESEREKNIFYIKTNTNMYLGSPNKNNNLSLALLSKLIGLNLTTTAPQQSSFLSQFSYEKASLAFIQRYPL